MDGGEHARALSEEAVLNNINGALSVISGENPDLVLLQEVDTDGTRSHHVNQKDIITQRLQQS